MTSKLINISNLNETKQLATLLSGELTRGDVVTLKGNLGAGKTTFVKALMHTLNSNVEITSPTFNLLHIYDTKLCEVWHFDLYRLKNEIEVYELGIEDAFNNAISLIEWPEIVSNILPKDRLDIELNFCEDEKSRTFKLSSTSERWISFINNLI